MPRDLIEYPETIQLDHVGEVLLRAALIVEKGWCRGGFCRHDFDGGDRHCMMGAILRAEGALTRHGRISDQADATTLIDTYRARLGFRDDRDMYEWNDVQDDRTTVAARMRAAAWEVPHAA